MSRPHRHTNRRTLGFEHLEAKKSPTSLTGLSAPIDLGNDGVAAEVSALGATDSNSLQSGKSDQLLSYVAAIESVDVQRALPSQVEATAVDRWLATNLPPNT